MPNRNSPFQPSNTTFGVPTFPSGGGLGGIATGACRSLGLPDSLCRAGVGVISDFFGGSDPQPGGNVASCPDGYVVASDGRCVAAGATGAIQRFLPGGQTGTLADGSGQAVVGAFGVPGMIPLQVGSIARADGSQGPILKCPAGMVLGKDNVCYAKGVIPRQFRKWKPGARPPISAADAKAIRKADSARNRVKKLAQKTGFSCKKR